MSSPSQDVPARGSLRLILGTLLCRVIVPLWILVGAIFKLLEANPGLLPRNILTAGDRLGMDLDVLLATLIAIEFATVAIMVCIGRLARATAIFMLAAFCLVLVGEIGAGRTSCGCMGANSPSPWTMLAIDGAMLIGVIGLGWGGLRAAPIGRAWPAVATMLTLVGAGVAYGKLLPDRTTVVPQITETEPGQGETETAGTTAVVEATGPELPSYWFESEIEGWIGQRYEELELVRFMADVPDGLGEGEQYLVFYRRTCDHCEDMFNHDFLEYPDLAAKVIAVEVPEDTEKMTGPNAWSMPDTACTLRELPLGVDWIMTTPLAVRLEDGVVQCATEGDHTECMGLEPHDHG